jgi:hypothetical protein
MFDQLSAPSADSAVWSAYAGQLVRKREREGAHTGCRGQGGGMLLYWFHLEGSGEQEEDGGALLLVRTGGEITIN